MTPITHDHLAAAVAAAAVALAATADRPHETALAMLAAIVEADRHALEANDLVGLGVITHDRYEAAAQARDEAIDRAAQWLRME